MTVVRTWLSLRSPYHCQPLWLNKHYNEIRLGRLAIFRPTACSIGYDIWANRRLIGLSVSVSRHLFCSTESRCSDGGPKVSLMAHKAPNHLYDFLSEIDRYIMNLTLLIVVNRDYAIINLGVLYTGCSEKNCTILVLGVTFTNVDQFSKFFHS